MYQTKKIAFYNSRIENYDQREVLRLATDNLGLSKIIGSSTYIVKQLENIDVSNFLLSYFLTFHTRRFYNKWNVKNYLLSIWWKDLNSRPPQDQGSCPIITFCNGKQVLYIWFGSRFKSNSFWPFNLCFAVVNDGQTHHIYFIRTKGVICIYISSLKA